TAYVSSSTSDQTSAIRLMGNEQLDAIAQGAGEMANAYIVSSVFNPANGGFRPAGSSAYHHFTFPGNSNAANPPAPTPAPAYDAFLADRIPDFNPAPASPLANTQHYYWRSISAPLSATGYFEAPVYENMTASAAGTTLSFNGTKTPKTAGGAPYFYGSYNA